MIKEALKFAADESRANLFEIDGVQFSDKPLTPNRVKRERCTNVIRLHTLSSLVEYLNKDVDDFDAEATGIIVHVVGPGKVAVFDSLDDDERNREHFVEVVTQDLDSFPFGRYLQQKEFITNAMVHFEFTNELKTLLHVVGTLREEAVRTMDDDGITQKVMASEGLRVGNVELPNPVTLRPLRTFAELEQPESKFIFRAQGGGKEELPTMGLFSVKDGLWQHEAIKQIEAYLVENITSDLVTVLA